MTNSRLVVNTCELPEKSSMFTPSNVTRTINLRTRRLGLMTCILRLAENEGIVAYLTMAVTRRMQSGFWRRSLAQMKKVRVFTVMAILVGVSAGASAAPEVKVYGGPTDEQISAAVRGKIAE